MKILSILFILSKSFEGRDSSSPRFLSFFKKFAFDFLVCFIVMHVDLFFFGFLSVSILHCYCTDIDKS